MTNETEVIERTVTAPDGRTLAVQLSGDPDGRPVLVHNGTPNSRHLYPPVQADARQRGLRLISYDRPGYGGSSPHPERVIADCAADVRAICAALGVDRLTMWSISGGGPHVLACAALLPGLVTAVASLAAMAPCDADGLDFLAGMGQANADDFRLFSTDQEAARRKTAQDRDEMLAASADEMLTIMKSLLCPADAAALTGDLVAYLLSSGKGPSPTSPAGGARTPAWPRWKRNTCPAWPGRTPPNCSSSKSAPAPPGDRRGRFVAGSVRGYVAGGCGRQRPLV